MRKYEEGLIACSDIGLAKERRHEYSRVLPCLAKRDLSGGGWLSENVYSGI